MLLAKVVELATVTTFQTHFYQWGGRIYQQSEGGPIGLKATGTVAKMAREMLVRKYQEAVEKAGMKIHQLT